MTQEEINNVTESIEINMEAFPNWRRGQTFFNVLEAFYPEEAEKIRATKYDPFHSESYDEAVEYLLKN